MLVSCVIPGWFPVLYRVGFVRPSCTAQAQNTESCMSEGCTFTLFHFGVVGHYCGADV